MTGTTKERLDARKRATQQQFDILKRKYRCECTILPTVGRTEAPMRNCKCGNVVANDAKSCPKCGHRFTSGCTRALAWIFGIFIGVAILGALITGSQNNQPPAPSPEQKAADQKKEERFQRAVAGAKQLQQSMRNPDSFKLAQVLLISNEALFLD